MRRGDLDDRAPARRAHAAPTARRHPRRRPPALPRDPPLALAPRRAGGVAAHVDVRLRAALPDGAHPGAAPPQPAHGALRLHLANAGTPVRRRRRDLARAGRRALRALSRRPARARLRRSRAAHARVFLGVRRGGLSHLSPRLPPRPRARARFRRRRAQPDQLRPAGRVPLRLHGHGDGDGSRRRRRGARRAQRSRDRRLELGGGSHRGPGAHRMIRAALTILMLSSLGGCGPAPLPTGHPTPATFFTAARTDTTFRVADHMLASIEMQISGEPFAQLLGRNLSGFDRFAKLTDQYTNPDTGDTITDPLGYASAIESYEYSKQPMNNLSFEAGAGLALEYGPILNAANVTDDAGVQLLLDRLQHLADLAHAGGPPMKAFVVSPAPLNNPRNVYGWPGYFPVMAEFASFRPDVVPTNGAARGCNFVGGYLA